MEEGRFSFPDWSPIHRVSDQKPRLVRLTERRDALRIELQQLQDVLMSTLDKENGVDK